MASRAICSGFWFGLMRSQYARPSLRNRTRRVGTQALGVLQLQETLSGAGRRPLCVGFLLMHGSAETRGTVCDALSSKGVRNGLQLMSARQARHQTRDARSIEPQIAQMKTGLNAASPILRCLVSGSYL
jgi:hypothetical protein